MSTETPFTAILGGGPFDGATRRILSDREYAWDELPPDVVHVAACPCCSRVVVWEPGRHPHAGELPEPLPYQQLVIEEGGNVHYQLQECPNART